MKAPQQVQPDGTERESKCCQSHTEVTAFFKIEAQQKMFTSAVLNLYYLFDWGQC